MNLVNSAIEKYCLQHSHLPDKVCDELEEYTRKNVAYSEMLVGKLEASFLGLLLQSIQAKKVLEIGTFTGYSALAMASQLPEDGKLLTMDVSAETVNLAKQFWDKSPHGRKIHFILGPALESLKNLPDQGPFDLVFIDADKVNYVNYIKATSPLLSSKGLMVIDNCLWSGRVLEEDEKLLDENTKAIKDVAKFFKGNDQFYATLLPIRDGIYIVKKLDNCH